MELDWRNRCVGGERLEDLFAVVHELGADNGSDLVDQLAWDPHIALPFHRALLRVAAELLWQEAARLRPMHVTWPDFDWLADVAFDELTRRAGIELSRQRVRHGC